MRFREMRLGSLVHGLGIHFAYSLLPRVYWLFPVPIALRFHIKAVCATLIEAVTGAPLLQGLVTSRVFAQSIVEVGYCLPH